jgi:esterase
MTLAGATYGSGPPIVFLHGLFGSGDNLRLIARQIESEYTCMYPDLPNHGESPHTDRFDYREMGEAVAELLESHSEAPAVVVGHSMGAKVAMHLALERPGAVRALVVLDMAPRAYYPSHREVMDAMLALPLHELESRADADRRLSDAIPVAAIRAFLLKNLVRDGEGYRWRLNLKTLRDDYDRILSWGGTGVYTGPSLFIAGSKSEYVKPVRDTSLIRQYFPRAEIEVVNGAGHWVHSERPEEVRSLLVEFLHRVAGRTS